MTATPHNVFISFFSFETQEIETISIYDLAKYGIPTDENNKEMLLCNGCEYESPLSFKDENGHDLNLTISEK